MLFTEHELKIDNSNKEVFYKIYIIYYNQWYD